MNRPDVVELVNAEAWHIVIEKLMARTTYSQYTETDLSCQRQFSTRYRLPLFVTCKIIDGCYYNVSAHLADPDPWDPGRRTKGQRQRRGLLKDFL